MTTAGFAGLSGAGYPRPAATGGGSVNDRLAALETAIDDLRSSVRHLEARLAHLEGRAASAEAAEPDAGAAAAGTVSAEAAPVARGWRDPVAVLSLAGRLFIVLGGAYLLRAMTDTGAIAPAAGVALALLTVGVARFRRPGGASGTAAQRRLPRRGRGDGGVPVVLEATTHFKVVSGRPVRRRLPSSRPAFWRWRGGGGCRRWPGLPSSSPFPPPSSSSPGRAWWCRTRSS